MNGIAIRHNQLKTRNSTKARVILNTVGFKKSFIILFFFGRRVILNYRLFFNHASSFFVDQVLITSSLVNHARLAVATP